MRPPNTHDLLAAMAVVATHFAVTRLVLGIHVYGLLALAAALPILLTALVHWRLRLNWRTASLLHYPIAIAWAFCVGATYSMYWSRIPRHFFERDSIGLSDPLHFGIVAAEVMAIIGLGTTLLYASVARYLYVRSAAGRLQEDSNDERAESWVRRSAALETDDQTSASRER